jgi:hypothetical protein
VCVCVRVGMLILHILCLCLFFDFFSFCAIVGFHLSLSHSHTHTSRFTVTVLKADNLFTARSLGILIFVGVLGTLMNIASFFQIKYGFLVVDFVCLINIIFVDNLHHACLFLPIVCVYFACK